MTDIETLELFVKIDSAIGYCENKNEYCTNITLNRKELYAISDALHNSGKHGWHDLAKDPTDLPSNYEDAYVCFESYRFGITNARVIDYGTGYAVNGKFSDFVNGESGWKDLKILGWRHIDPFEEETPECEEHQP